VAVTATTTAAINIPLKFLARRLAVAGAKEQHPDSSEKRVDVQCGRNPDTGQRDV
jgi:hypothetical protein